MTEVSFYFNVADKRDTTCRLLRKAVQQGAQVAVTGESAALQQLDRELWVFSEVEFVPHCLQGADATVLAASPVVLCEQPAAAPHRQVLLNLGDQVPTGFETFERLLEVVGTDEPDRLRSRQRWKFYADRGYAVSRHDMAAREVA